MNRNAMNHFMSNAVDVKMRRSKWKMPKSLKTSFNSGQLIPIYYEEVLPGDTWKMKTSLLTRLQAMVTPVMDNIYLDTFWFFVPNRLVYEHWQELCGENKTSAWKQETEYTVPQIESPSGGWNVGTIADYLGIPTGVDNLSVSALPFRGYALICNEFFRSTPLSDPLNIPLGDSTQTGTNGSSYINDVANGGVPFQACKLHDAYTSCLPSPQCGDDVTIKLLEATGNVYGNEYGLGLSNGTNVGTLNIGSSTPNNKLTTSTLGDSKSTSTGTGSDNMGIFGIATKAQLGDHPEYSGLTAEIGSANLITINQLREAFQMQKYFEKLAISGNRYIELVRSMFGVTSPDARLQRPEYLGGTRVNVSVNSLYQTSETGTTPQGNAAAYSVTSDVHKDFTKSFSEHGMLFGLACVRYDHTYQQGIPESFCRKTKFDFYWPVFANLGNRPVYNRNIYAQGSSAINPSTGKAYDDEVFGYQEAWYEYRYTPNRVTGEMRSSYTTSLDNWHLADDYSSMPFLSDDWIREDPNNLDRCLTVKHTVSNQIFGDFYFDVDIARVMPLVSIPGLIDHH